MSMDSARGGHWNPSETSFRSVVKGEVKMKRVRRRGDENGKSILLICKV